MIDKDVINVDEIKDILEKICDSEIEQELQHIFDGESFITIGLDDEGEAIIEISTRLEEENPRTVFIPLKGVVDLTISVLEDAGKVRWMLDIAEELQHYSDRIRDKAIKLKG